MAITKVALHFLYFSMKKKLRRIPLNLRFLLFSTFDSKTTERPKIFLWPFFLVLWPYLLTTKLRCLQKNNIGHTNLAKQFLSGLQPIPLQSFFLDLPFSPIFQLLLFCGKVWPLIWRFPVYPELILQFELVCWLQIHYWLALVQFFPNVRMMSFRQGGK